MTKTSGHGAIAIIAIVAIVAVLWSTGALGGTKSVSGLTTTTPGGTVGTVVLCPNTQNIAGKVQYMDWTKLVNGQPTPTLINGQTINVYAQLTPTTYSGTVTYTATSSSSGSTPVPSSGNVNCNIAYLYTAGDQSSYLLNGTVFNSGTASSVPVTLTVLKYAAATLTNQNASTSAFAQTANVHSVTSGRTYNPGIQIAAGAGYDSSGPGVIIFVYNSLAFTITMQGATQVSTGLLPAVSFVTSNTNFPGLAVIGSQNQEIAFQVPAASYYQYTTLSGPSTSTGATISPALTTSSGYSSNELVSEYFVPASDFYNTASGQLQTGQYINPSTQASLVSTVYDLGALAFHTSASGST